MKKQGPKKKKEEVGHRLDPLDREAAWLLMRKVTEGNLLNWQPSQFLALDSNRQSDSKRIFKQAERKKIFIIYVISNKDTQIKAKNSLVKKKK